MKKNIGINDRIVRLLLASMIAILHFTGAIPTTMAPVFLAIAIIFLLTGLLSICPLYSIFHINTCEPGEQEKG